jgi:hypothetical protein
MVSFDSCRNTLAEARAPCTIPVDATPGYHLEQGGLAKPLAAADRNPGTPRRRLLQGMAATAIAAALPLRVSRAETLPRVAVIGGGMAGVASAWLLDGVCDVRLFEARESLGGNIRTLPISLGGQTRAVDLGAQFFHPDTHPIYVMLLEEIGLYDPEHPEADETLESPGSLCVFPVDGGPPVLSSANPLSTLPQALGFAAFTQLAQVSVCGLYHTVEQRLCRWLLTVHDRVNGDELLLTQEILAGMIGARRPTVSIVSGKLQKAGLIRVNRGRITLLDRAGIENATCECYRVIRGALDLFLER